MSKVVMANEDGKPVFLMGNKQTNALYNMGNINHLGAPTEYCIVNASDVIKLFEYSTFETTRGRIIPEMFVELPSPDMAVKFNLENHNIQIRGFLIPGDEIRYHLENPKSQLECIGYMSVCVTNSDDIILSNTVMALDIVDNRAIGMVDEPYIISMLGFPHNDEIERYYEDLEVVKALGMPTNKEIKENLKGWDRICDRALKVWMGVQIALLNPKIVEHVSYERRGNDKIAFTNKEISPKECAKITGIKHIYISDAIEKYANAIRARKEKQPIFVHGHRRTLHRNTPSEREIWVRPYWKLGDPDDGTDPRRVEITNM